MDLAAKAEVADARGYSEHAGEGELGGPKARAAHIREQVQRFPCRPSLEQPIIMAL
jgi:hypothetical protein